MFPLQIKQTVIDCVFEYLDRVDPCHEFSPSEVQVYVSYRTNGRCKPQDGTVTRYFRMYNERRCERAVINTNRAKSRYRMSVEADPDVNLQPPSSGDMGCDNSTGAEYGCR